MALSWKKIFSSFNLFYFFMMIMYVAQGNELTRGATIFTGNIFYLIVPIVLTTYFIIKNKISFNHKGFYIIIGVYSFWALFSFLKYKSIHPGIFFIYLQLIMGFCIVRVFRYNMLYLFEEFVSKLSFFCLFVWVSNLLLPSFWHFVCSYIAFDRGDSISRYNFFFASIINSQSHPEMMFRNPGFSWEPGMHASICCVALFINLARTHFNLKYNYNFYILLVSILSTFSTTGYFCLLVIIIPFYLLNKNTKKLLLLLLLLLLLPIGVMIFQLDFMGEKLNNLISSEESIYVASNIGGDRVSYVPQRFDGLVFEYMNIIHDPLLGYGPSSTNSFVNRHISDILFLSNGTLKIFARYGLILGIFISIIMFYSSKLLGFFWNCKYSWMFFILYELISVSYNFFWLPLFIALLYSCLFLDKADINIETKYLL